MVSCFLGTDQFPYMFHATLSRCVREISHTTDLQCTALYFHKVFPEFLTFHIEIDPGAAIGIFRNNPVIRLFFQPLLHHFIRSLTVNIKEHAGILSNRNQIILCFSIRCSRRGKPHLCSRHQKLPASSGILYMNEFSFSCQFYLGHETIGSRQKCGTLNIIVFHSRILLLSVRQLPTHILHGIPY